MGEGGEPQARGARFRAALRSRAAAAQSPPSTASPPGLSPAPTLVERAPRETSIRAVAPRPEISRVLVGQAHATRAARIELGGALAGATIHLVTGPGGIEVRLGAASEGARLALATAIDRARLELRSRGIVMRPGAALDTGARQNPREGRERR